MAFSYNDVASRMMLTAAIISIISTSMVIGKIGFSNNLRRKSYMQMVLFSAISDFISSPLKAVGSSLLSSVFFLLALF